MREQDRAQVCSGKEREFNVGSTVGKKWRGRARTPALGMGDAGDWPPRGEQGAGEARNSQGLTQAAAHRASPLPLFKRLPSP